MRALLLVTFLFVSAIAASVFVMFSLLFVMFSIRRIHFGVGFHDVFIADREQAVGFNDKTIRLEQRAFVSVIC